MIIDQMIMLDIKKSYAYRQISSEAKVNPETNELVEGNIFEKPTVEKKSGLGVKTDMIEMTKKILDYLITLTFDDSVLLKDKYNTAIKKLRDFYTEFENSLLTFNATLIGTPIRWQKKINAINAMKLYNATVENVFQYLTVGNLIYCSFASEKAISDLNIDVESGKLNAIAIPLKFNPDLISNSFKKYGITFDKSRQWENILNLTCKRLLTELKKASEK